MPSAIFAAPTSANHLGGSLERPNVSMPATTMSAATRPRVARATDFIVLEWLFLRVGVRAYWVLASELDT
jgi:hypothetical protein